MFTKRRCPRIRPGRLALMALLLLPLPLAAYAQDSAAEAYQKAYDLVLDEKWSQATDALRDFLDRFSSSDWADDAEFWRCYTQEKTTRSDENAFDCYQGFVEDHPRSKYADDARGNMVQLARRLARSGKREYLTIVESMEGDEDVRLAALDALWQMGDENALDAILDLYDSSGSEKYRKKVIFALSQFDGSRAAEKLKDIALQDPNPDLRGEAIFWISQRNGREAIPLLEEIANAEDSPEVQKKIIFAYSQLGDEGVPQLIRIARGAGNVEVQKEAIFWLGQIGGAEVMEFFDELIDSSASVNVQKSLVFAFSQAPEHEGVPRLIDIARTHRNAEIRKDAIFWLSQAGGQRVMDFFNELIAESDDYEVQKSLVFALSQLGDEGLPRLVDIARTHPNRDIRKEAFFWISQEGGPEALRFFEERLDEETDVEVLKQIVFALSQLDDEGVPGLIKAAKTHPNRQVRKDAVFWLGQTDDPRARDALLEIARGQ